MKSKYDELLEYFRLNDQPSFLELEMDKKIFFQLQKYNLLRLNSEGRLIITPQGEKALSVGVEIYIRKLRLANKVVRDASKLKKERTVLSAVVIVLAIGFTISQLSSLDNVLMKLISQIF